MELDALMPLLNGLGPWGVLIGAALVLLVQRLRKTPDGQPAPAPQPVPAPQPLPNVPDLSNRPLLELASRLLAALLAQKAMARGESVEDGMLKAVAEQILKKE